MKAARNQNRLISICLAFVMVMATFTNARAEEGISKIDIPQLESLIAGNHGKVTLVNFWATWCPPCLKEFPDLIKLYNEYHPQGLEVVAVSMNEPDEMEDIDEFLQERNPPFPIYMAATLDEEFYQGISEEWMGTIPLTLIFDTEGNNAHYHHKEVNFEGLEKDISVLLPQ